MELLEQILAKENLNQAYEKVKANKGVAGVGGITVHEVDDISIRPLCKSSC